MINPEFDLIRNIVGKLLVFIGRPDIRLQLLIIVIVFAGAQALSRLTWLTIEQRVRQAIARLPGRVQPYFFFLKQLARAISFPLLGLIFLNIIENILLGQGWLVGLLIRFRWIFGTLLFFQIIVTFLYTLFDKAEVKKYHYRFIIPLFLFVILLEIISNLADITALADIILVTIFNSPLTLGALFIATLGLYFWTDALRISQDLILHVVTTRTRVEPGSAKASLTLARYILFIAGIGYAISQLELDSTTVAAITGGLSVGVGFGLREILSNFVSGLFLLFERSLQPGDVIEVDDELSVVQDLSIRATIVRTLNNVELIIPNQMFLLSSFKSYTGTDKKVRVPIIIRASCENDMESLITLLIDTAHAHPEVMSEPAASVFLLEFGDNVISFQLNIWLDTPIKIPPVSSEVRRRVWRAFSDEGIDLTFPDLAVQFVNELGVRGFIPAGQPQLDEGQRTKDS